MPHNARRCPAVRQPVSSMFKLSLAAHALSKLLVGLRERLAGALQDRLDRAGAQAHTEQLFAELHNITARDAVAHRQHRHGRFKTRAERAVCDIGGQQCPRPLDRSQDSAPADSDARSPAQR